MEVPGRGKPWSPRRRFCTTRAPTRTFFSSRPTRIRDTRSRGARSFRPFPLSPRSSGSRSPAGALSSRASRPPLSPASPSEAFSPVFSPTPAAHQTRSGSAGRWDRSSPPRPGSSLSGGGFSPDTLASALWCSASGSPRGSSSPIPSRSFGTGRRIRSSGRLSPKPRRGPGDSCPGSAARLLFLDPSAVRYPFNVDVLAGPRDADVPTPPIPRRTPSEIRLAPPGAPFWYVTTPAGLSLLREAGWRCARGIAPNDAAPGVVVAFVRPG